MAKNSGFQGESAGGSPKNFAGGRRGEGTGPDATTTGNDLRARPSAGAFSKEINRFGPISGEAGRRTVCLAAIAAEPPATVPAERRRVKRCIAGRSRLRQSIFQPITSGRTR